MVSVRLSQTGCDFNIGLKGPVMAGSVCLDQNKYVCIANSTVKLDVYFIATINEWQAIVSDRGQYKALNKVKSANKKVCLL